MTTSKEIYWYKINRVFFLILKENPFFKANNMSFLNIDFIHISIQYKIGIHSVYFLIYSESIFLYQIIS